MQGNSCELLYRDEGYRIVGAALEVSRELGAGFFESVYQEALGYEFQAQNIPYVPQPTIRISYKDRIMLRWYEPDFLCFDEIVVEIKAIKALTPIEQGQLLNYLRATGNEVGVLINFGSPRLEWKRMVLSNRATTDAP